MSSKETPPVIQIVSFAIESCLFQDKLLNGIHSISDTKETANSNRKQPQRSVKR